MTFNCAHRLIPILDKLRQLDVPIIAVDNASSDGTVEVLTSRPEVDVIALPVNIGAAGRNRGVQQATTSYVLFCDDDGWWEPGGLTAAVAMLEAHPRLAVVNARILVGDQSRLDGISAEMADSPLPDDAGIPGPVLLSFMGGAVLVRRSAYLAVGGYDPVFFMGGEEETLALPLLRAGWRLRYFPELVMRHYPSVANAPQLRAYGLRNTLWNAWLHRRLRSALRWTIFTLADTPKNSDWLRGVGMAMAGAGWVRRRRRPIDPELDDALSILDARRFAARRPLSNRIDPVRTAPRSGPSALRTTRSAVFRSDLTTPPQLQGATRRAVPESVDQRLDEELPTGQVAGDLVDGAVVAVGVGPEGGERIDGSQL